MATVKSREKTYLKNYQPPTYQILKTNLYFDIGEDLTRVTAQSEFKATGTQRELHLNGHELKLIEIKIDEQTLKPHQYQVDSQGLTLTDLPESFTLSVVTELKPSENTSLEGLYESEGIICTQNEAQGFRKITYFLDRPDVMPIFSCTIEADKKKYPVLLSNGNLLKEENIGDTRHKATWLDPFKKPCYLFALVAGDLGCIQDQFITQTGKKVDLYLYASHGKQDRCLFAMDCLKKAMKWDEETYELEYDLNRYMIVAINDFNAGAMENKGLNIFNSRLIFADFESATDEDFAQIDSVVAHEYFHNWSGNRVTLRDWFYLSLKEGLTVFRDQEYTSDNSSRAVKRIEDVEFLKARQFPEDEGPTAHPVVPDSCYSVDNFFTMTIYEKGSEVIRMLQTLVGRPAFIKALKLYFQKFDGCAVTLDDFAQVISESAQIDLSQFRNWYEQAGLPHLQVQSSYDSAKKSYTLNFKQSCPPTPGQTQKPAFHIPLLLGLVDKKGQNLLKTEPHRGEGTVLLHIKKSEENITFTGIESEPIPSLLREFSAPVKLQYNYKPEELLFLMAYDTDSFNRWSAAQQVYIKDIKQRLKARSSGSSYKISPQLIEAYQIALKSPIDPSFKSLLLSLPTPSSLAAELDKIEPENFWLACNDLKVDFLTALESELVKTYEELKNSLSDSDRTQLSFGKRRLKNLCLDLLASKHPHLVQEQYESSTNMTDQLYSLNTSWSQNLDFKNELAEDFYKRWSKDSITLNKWISAQALDSSPEALSTIKKVSSHKSFNFKNPNNVMSLWRNFMINNTYRFHDSSGESYDLLGDTIKALDPINPQTAARLCGELKIWPKLPTSQAKKLYQVIEQVSKANQLSANTFEILKQCLEAGKP